MSLYVRDCFGVRLRQQYVHLNIHRPSYDLRFLILSSLAYYDVNGKDGSPLLTCALFYYSHTAADADNRGGQTQPNGFVDYIIDSDGFCKL
jgi:hypothetical protein